MDPNTYNYTALDGDEVYQSAFGAIVPRYISSLSTIGSCLILYLIFMSPAGLSSVYHRIMLGVSVSDIVTSLASCLTTLPMPKDEPFVNLYGFEGTRSGNTATCTAQGFFYMTGNYCSFMYYASLCTYYACTIVFSISETKVKKKFEPWLHIVPIFTSLSFSIPPIFMEMYNPGFSLSWCTIRAHPNYCNDPDCVRGSPKYAQVLRRYTAAILFSDFFVIIVLLTLVCRKVYKQNSQLNQYIKQQEKEQIETSSVEMTNDNVTTDNNAQVIASRFQMTKVVVLHSVAYVAAFSITLLVPILFTTVFKGDYTRKIHLILTPLQGFFNFLIFLWSKVVTLRLLSPELSVFGALKELFCNRQHKEDVILISNINFIKDEDGILEVEVRSFQEEGDNHLISEGTSTRKSGSNGTHANEISYNSADWDGFNSNPSTDESMSSNVSRLVSSTGSKNSSLKMDVNERDETKSDTNGLFRRGLKFAGC